MATVRAASILDEPATCHIARESIGGGASGDAANRKMLCKMLSSTFRYETDYHDLGGRYLADRDKHHIIRRLLRRLHDLGVAVEVKAA